MEEKKYKSFSEFYPYYIEEHDNKHTKLMHFIGTSLSIYFLIKFLLSFNFLFIVTLNIFYLLLIPLSGYGFAWVSHFFIEKNKPATFTYPFYSLVSDYIMFFEILRGKHRIF